MPVSMTVLTPQISGHHLQTHPQPPLVRGQFKVSNLTPETRSPCWMWSGESRVEIIGLSLPGHDN